MNVNPKPYLRFWLSCWLLLSVCPIAMAQSNPDGLLSFNERRIKLNKRSMLVLGGWATANILAGSILAGRSEGTRKHFHQMNAYWNTVNLAIAGFGYYQATKEIPSDIDLAGTVGQQYSIQQALLFNTGLDIAYMAGGVYLVERSKNSSKYQARLKGFGQSLILQGAFLFAFDLSVFLMQQSYQPELKELLSHIRLSPQGIGLRIRL